MNEDDIKSGSFLQRVRKLLLAREREIKELNKVKETLSRALKNIDKARQQAEKEKDKTMALISNFSTPIIFLDNDNRLALFNPLAEEILGIKRADLGVKVFNDNNSSLNNFFSIIHNKLSVNKLIEELDGTKLEEVTVKYKNEDRIYKVATSNVSEKDGN